MFSDIGWAELLVIGVVALIVIGPEDLPDMFRQLGRFTAKIRQMSREFSRAMEDAAKQSGVKDVTDDLKSMTSAKSLGLDKVREAADRFEKWDPIKGARPASAARPLVPPAMPATLQPDTAGPAADMTGTPVATGDGAAAAAPPAGPATEALRARQAAKKAVLRDATKKLRAIDAAASPAAAAAPTDAPSATATRTARTPRKAAKPAPQVPDAPADLPKTAKSRKTAKADKA